MYWKFDQARECAERDLKQANLNRKKDFHNLAPGPDLAGRLSRLSHSTKSLQGAILHYTKAANMAVVTCVANLPQELRDNIYTQLWEMDGKHDPTRSLFCWWESFYEPWLSKGDDPSKPPWQSAAYANLRPPHFIDRSFVGSVFAKEALKVLKDSAGRDLRPIGETDPVTECGLLDTSMRDFFCKDVFGVGVTMEELVRNLDLRVTFQCDALNDDEFPEMEESKESEGSETDDEGPSSADKKVYTLEDYLSGLNDGVTALLGISHTERVTTHNEHVRHMRTRARVITLAIRQEEGFEWRDHSPLLKLVARAYHGLRAKGFTVKVQYYSEGIELKVLFEDDVWEWTENDWERNLIWKNTFPGLDAGNSTQRYVWAQLQQHVFRRPDNDESTI